MSKSKLLEKIQIILMTDKNEKEILEVIRALKMFYDYGTRTYTPEEWNANVIPERQFDCGTLTCRPICKLYFEYEKRLVDLGGVVDAAGREADEIRDKMNELFMQFTDEESDQINKLRLKEYGAEHVVQTRTKSRR